jgi:hypothetical protein
MSSEAAYSHTPTAIGSGVCPRSSTSKPVNDGARPPTLHSTSSQADPPSLLTVTPAMKSSLKESNLLALWTIVSPLLLLSIGLVLGALLPYAVTAALFCLVTLVPAIRQLLRVFGVLATPYADRVLHQRTTAVIEGDFVVFLIGSRPNNAFPLDGQVRALGKAFMEMIAQLEASSSEVGFLGGDPYVGDHPGRSTFLSVQYWRSYEQLHAWAKSPAAQHLAVWKAFNKAGGVAASSYGIWHESAAQSTAQTKSKSSTTDC